MVDISMADLIAKRAAYQEEVGVMYEQVVKGLPPASDTSKLLEDMRKMVNNPDYADTTFFCQDGEYVVACRLLLVARSPVLRKMLMNGMAETYLSVIPMPNVSSSVLLVVFEFLYVGAITKDHFEAPAAFLQWSKIFAVITAARFFMLDALEAIACQLLWADLVESIKMPYTDDVVRMLGFRLSAACEFSNLLNVENNVGTLDIICMELVDFLGSADLTEGHLQTFSCEGISNYLFMTQSTYNDDGAVSFGEYVRVRQLIMWCNSRVLEESRLKDMDAYLPGPKAAMSLLNEPRALKSFEEEFVHFNHQLWWAKVSEQLSPSLLKSLMSSINLSVLHPAILIRLIEPLQVFRQEDLIRALRVHATLSFDWNFQLKLRVDTPSVYPWKFTQGGYHTGVEDASILLRGNSNVPGAAISSLAIPPYGIFEWDITLLADTRESLQVGFVSFYKRVLDMIKYNPSCLNKNLGVLPSSWALTMKAGFAAGVNNNIYTSKNWSLPVGKAFGKKLKAVRVHLNRFENTCYFSYDGENSGTLWTDLPHGIFYPAVSFTNTTSRGARPLSVRMTLVRGHEYL